MVIKSSHFINYDGAVSETCESVLGSVIKSFSRRMAPAGEGHVAWLVPTGLSIVDIISPLCAYDFIK